MLLLLTALFRRIPQDVGSAETKSVLFVCLGNICRSPTAEGVFRTLVERAGLSEAFEIDSAGTGAWHAGEPPDARMTKAARRRGYALAGSARQVLAEDLDRFDLVLAMDGNNLRDLEGLTGPRPNLRLFRDFDPQGSGDVPDPYYGGPEGFDHVVMLAERTCRALLDQLGNEGPSTTGFS